MHINAASVGLSSVVMVTAIPIGKLHNSPKCIIAHVISPENTELRPITISKYQCVWMEVVDAKWSQYAVGFL